MESVVSEQLIKMPGNAAARIIDPASFPNRPRGLSKMMTALWRCWDLVGLLSGVARSLADKRIYSAIDPGMRRGFRCSRGAVQRQKESSQTYCPKCSPTANRESDTQQLGNPEPAADRKTGASRLVDLGYVVHPAPSTQPSADLVMLSNPDGARAEQYRLPCCRLPERGNPRLLMVVSSQPSEGKSTVAANLALAMSEGGGAKVAVIDAHPARAASAKLMMPHSEPTPSDIRERKPEVWQVTPDLCLVPATGLGQRQNRAAVENSPALRHCSKDLQVAFDYVIVDTPPLSLAADARLFAPSWWNCTSVVRAARTDLEELGLALDRISRHAISAWS